MWFLLLNLFCFLPLSFCELRLNPNLELNNNAIALGPEKGKQEKKPNTTDKPCTKPDAIYQSSGPINIYLNGGLIQQGMSQNII
jgi:hypothetical protein